MEHLLREIISGLKRIERLIEHRVCDARSNNALSVPIGPVSEQRLTKGDLAMGQSLTLTDSQLCGIGPIAALDAKGNPASLGGALVFTSSDPTIATVTADTTGLSANIVSVGPLGNAQITVTDGVLTGTLDLTIVGGAEATLSIPVAAPIAQ